MQGWSFWYRGDCRVMSIAARFVGAAPRHIGVKSWGRLPVYDVIAFQGSVETVVSTRGF